MRKLMAMLLVLLMLLCACGQQNAQLYSVYYRVTEQEQIGGRDILQACDVQIPGSESMDVETLARALLEKLFGDSVPLGCAKPVEQEVRVLNVSLQDSCMLVQLAEGYGSLRGLKRTLADSAIVMTLSQLEGVEKVQLKYGRYERLLSAEDVLLSMEALVEEIPVELYYLDQAGDLVAVDHLLLVPEGKDPGELLVQDLREAPTSVEGLASLLPENFKVLSMDLQGESYYVNLDKETVRQIKQSGLEQETYLALEMSLRSLQNVKTVVFMNEGSVIYRNEDLFPLM